MAKAQVKKAGGARKIAAVKAAVRGKAPAAKSKPAAKKTSPPPSKKAAPARKALKPAPKPVAKPSPKARPARPAAKPVKVAAKPAKPARTAKPAKATAKPTRVAKPSKPAKAAKPVGKAVAAVRAVAAAVTKVVAKVKPAPKAKKPEAVPPAPPSAPVARNVPSVAAPAAAADKKRTRRPRLRITSSGAPAAAWLTTEKPRPASFIPAPPRAEAPSAIAAPPASSDRLIRPEDLSHVAVRTVPVRVDIEQGAGRFYVIANPQEVVLKAGEGIEWDFRYIGGADVNVDEVIIEFDKPSPFASASFKTRKPGGARPHRQLSGGADASATGKRVEYVIRAMNAFKTEVARARVAVNVS